MYYLKLNTMSADQTDRKSRSMNQTMYLMEAHRIGTRSWVFSVQGFSGFNYDVELNTNSASCTCPDFRTRGKLCKHIYFIYTKILQLEDTLDSVSPDGDVSDIDFVPVPIDEALVHRLFFHQEDQKQKKEDPGDSKDTAIEILEDDCCICFEGMSSIQSLVSCPTCKNKYHDVCYQRWQKKSCPLCRTKFTVSTKTGKAVKDIPWQDCISDEIMLSSSLFFGDHVPN